jgi:hypothetical protein
MSLELSAFVTVNPAYHDPEILVQYTQRSGFIDLLRGSTIRPNLAEDDLLVYAKQLNLRTRVAAGQSTYNELPSVDLAMNMISTPSYMFRTRVQYNHHDVRAGGHWGLGVPEAYRLGMRQGHFQMLRDACLYGMRPENGEGLLNAPGATFTNLPADSLGHTTVVNYDNGEMAFFLLSTILAIKVRTTQLGIGRHFSFVGPQRTLGQFQYNVVQVTQFQRTGAGTASTVETMQTVAMANGDTVSWGYDDTLEGAGPGGSDYVICSMPEVEVIGGDGINTNVFASNTPNNPACVTQYCDMPAPREIVSPMPDGYTNVLTEHRATSGWAVRPQALTVIAMPYS